MNRTEVGMLLAAGVLLFGSRGGGGKVPAVSALQWQWPMPRLVVGSVTLLPVVSDGFRKTRPDHDAVDICYETARLPPDVRTYVKAATFPLVSAGKGYWVPPGVPVLTCAAGTVWSASKGKRGWTVDVVHSRGRVRTRYHHLATLALDWQRGMLVGRGVTLGTCGDDPANPRDVRHLHFELAMWSDENRDFVSVDPEPLLRGSPHADLRHVVNLAAGGGVA